MKGEAPENLELKYQLAIHAFLYRVISSTISANTRIK